MAYRRQIQDWCRRLGLDVRRFRPLAGDAFAAQMFLLRNTSCQLIFDVGGYRGEVANRYAQLFPQAEIWTFEPFPASYNLLHQRFLGNARIHPVNSAVSSETGQVPLYANRLAATNSLLPRPASGRRYYAKDGVTVEQVTVSTVSLDDFRTERQLAAPDILKMDIQGKELDALRGAESTLRSGETKLIYTEVMFVPHYEGSALFYELAAFLATFGYTLFGLYDLKWARIGQIRAGDAIFVSDALRTDVINQLPDE